MLFLLLQRVRCFITEKQNLLRRVKAAFPQYFPNIAYSGIGTHKVRDV
jgi:hypothetical protein